MAKKKQSKETGFGRSNLVIGLTGPFGSGCGEMRKILEGRGFRPFKISDEIRGELGKKKKLIDKGKPDWRKTLQDHGDKKRDGKPDYWIRKVVNGINGIVRSWNWKGQNCNRRFQELFS